MKFGTIFENGLAVAILRGSDGNARQIAEAGSKAGIVCVGGMLEIVARSGTDDRLPGRLAEAAETVKGFDLDGVDWASPLPNPSKILGVAFNNKVLMKKTHRDPGVPMFFLKPPSALQGHGRSIVVDPEWGEVMPEPDSAR